MQNSLRSELNFYNRELQAIQKSISTKDLQMGKHSKCHKSFLKPKSDLGAFSKHGKEGPTQIKSKRLRLNDQKYNEFTQSFSRHDHQSHKQQRQSIHGKTSDFPTKYLEELDESYIHRNDDSSVFTRSQNHKIILEIHDLDIQRRPEARASCQISETKQLEKRMKQTIQTKQDKDHQARQHKKFHSLIREGESTTEDLLQILKQRNKIYELARLHCPSFGKDNVDSIEKMWSQYQVYEKIAAIIENKKTY